MKTPALFLTVLLAGGAAIAPATLSFSPKDGQELRVEYARVLKLSMVDSTSQFLVGGNQHPMSDTEGTEFNMTETETIVFVDRYTVKDDVLLVIERQVEEVSTLTEQDFTDPEGETFENSESGGTELEGASLVFTRSDAGEEFVASFAEKSADLDEDLLMNLEARADFAGFLASGQVAEGDEWEVPLSAFIQLTNPSGDLSMLPAGQGSEADRSAYRDLFKNNLEGDFTATWEETREEDGHRLAVLKLEAELKTSIAEEFETDASGTVVTELQSDLFDFQLEGLLIWDMTGHHAYSMDLGGDVQLARSTVKEFEMEGSEVRITKIMKFEGGVTYKVSEQ